MGLQRRGELLDPRGPVERAEFAVFGQDAQRGERWDFCCRIETTGVENLRDRLATVGPLAPLRQTSREFAPPARCLRKPYAELPQCGIDAKGVAGAGIVFLRVQ